jgi:hypothetical protein
MITSRSRYASGEVLWVNTTSRGNKQTVYLNTVVVLVVPYTVALVKETDSQPVYAYQTYRDANRWWTIADVNPQVFYPLDLIPGESMRIPT